MHSNESGASTRWNGIPRGAGDHRISNVSPPCVSHRRRLPRHPKSAPEAWGQE